MSQMVRGVTYRPTERIDVIREALALAQALTLVPSDRFRCDGYVLGHYRFGREFRWGGLRQVHGLLNGEPATLRVETVEPAVWQVADSPSHSGGAT